MALLRVHYIIIFIFYLHGLNAGIYFIFSSRLKRKWPEKIAQNLDFF